MKPLDRPIRNVDDLKAAWRFVDGGHGYSAPQLFALLIGADGYILPSVIQMYDDEFIAGPDEELVTAFVERLGEALEEFAPGGSVAIRKARPGSLPMTTTDRRWCQSLHRDLEGARLASWPLYFATDASLGMVPADQLIAHAS